MQGSEILTHAAKIIESYGWAQGANARDTDDKPCRITSPEAAYFSVYGAVMRAMMLADLIVPGGDDKAVQGFQPMWDVLTRRARQERRDYTHVHPVFDFNDAPGRTQAGVIELLLDAADELKTLETAKTDEKDPK